MNKHVFWGALGLLIVAAAFGAAFWGESHLGERSTGGDQRDQATETGKQPAIHLTARTERRPPTADFGSSSELKAAAEGPVKPSSSPKKSARTPVAPKFGVVRVNPSGDIVISGVAAPNAEVLASDGARELGRTRADKRGHWVLLPNTQLAPGPHQLTLESRDGVERDTPTVPSERKVVLVVPEPGKDIAGRPNETETGALALAVPRIGTGASRILQKPKVLSLSEQSRETKPKLPVSAPAADTSAGRTGPQASDLKLDTVDYDEEGRVEISGRALKGAHVRLYLDNKPVGRAQADKSGQWQLAPKDNVKPGSYRLRVDQVDRAGAVAARIESPFTRAGPLGDLPRGTVVFVQPGNSLWRIARRTYGEGIQFTVIYQANRQQIRDPDLIYPGQIFVIPKPVKDAG